MLGDGSIFVEGRVLGDDLCVPLLMGSIREGVALEVVPELGAETGCSAMGTNSGTEVTTSVLVGP